ncbi:MAG TPA: hypothetical protein VF599_15050 [Pyrinomonadaceae bacterium]|jgi:hypothetical protein
MISGQTLFINQTEENFILAQNETKLVESTEVIETVEETTLIENNSPQIDLKMKFARLKKAMRKRSVSIF